MSAWPVLTVLLTLPLLAGLLGFVWPHRSPRLAEGATLTGLLLAGVVWAGFDPAHTPSPWQTHHVWLPAIGATFHLDIDALSLPFVIATQILFAAVVWFRPPRAATEAVLLGGLQSATLGVLLAQDGLLFFAFWEATLFPVFFLLTRHSPGKRAVAAALQYTLTQLLAGVPLLLGLAWGALIATDDRGFGLTGHALPVAQQWPIFLLLLVGFGCKVPLVPLHHWLPTLAREGSAGLLAILTGLKLGAYGLLKIALPMAPEAAAHLHWLLAALGAAGLVAGTLAMLAQTNLRLVLAYASLAHVGLVVLALAAGTPSARLGTSWLLLHFSLAATGLALLAGAIHDRMGSTDQLQLGGLATVWPRLNGALLFFALASIGLPLTGGFPGELLALIGIFDRYPGAAIGALILAAIGAAALIQHIRAMMHGPLRHANVALPSDLGRRELTVLGVLAALSIGFGLWPGPLLGHLGAAL